MEVHKTLLHFSNYINHSYKCHLIVALTFVQQIFTYIHKFLLTKSYKIEKYKKPRIKIEINVCIKLTSAFTKHQGINLKKVITGNLVIIKYF